MLPAELNSVFYTNNLTLGASVEGIRILQKGETQVDVLILKIHLGSHPDQNCFSFEARGLVLLLEHLKSIIKTRHTDKFSVILLMSTPPCFHKVDRHCIKKPFVFNCPHFNFITHSHVFKNSRLFVLFFVSLVKTSTFIICFQY